MALEDRGPDKMTENPQSLIESKRDALKAIAQFAVGDARRFNGSEEAKSKEEKLRTDLKRATSIQQAEQAAGGKKHYKQSILKAVYEHTCQAAGAVCTTFALCAAHILTNGERQMGNVRVEIIGVKHGYAGLATHMYVVCGRMGNNLNDRRTWGSQAVIIDLWVAAMDGKPSAYAIPVSKVDDKALWFDSKHLQRFYDNVLPDPSVEIISVNVSMVEHSAMQRELQSLQEEKRGLPFNFTQRHKELDERIAELQHKLQPS